MTTTESQITSGKAESTIDTPESLRIRIENLMHDWRRAVAANNQSWVDDCNVRIFDLIEAVREKDRKKAFDEGLTLMCETVKKSLCDEFGIVYVEGPDQTYLQQAQPSTFAHYVLSFVYPAMRDARRLLEEYDDINRSPAGAGCVNGTRLLDDRGYVASALGFGEVIEHTRDAMWQIDGLIHVLASASSLLSTQSKLAEDLEIWSSSEFDFVDLADPYTRSSVLMPQKRNPYSLSIVRGASGVLIGRLTGFLAVAKSPSARSDNLIFAYGEVPRALDLAIRVTRLMTGVMRTIEVNVDQMAHGLDDGYTQATDLSEFIVQTVGLDYRSAYDVVGRTVREASKNGIPGRRITGAMLDEAAVAVTGQPLGLTSMDLSAALDPAAIIGSRKATGGAAASAVHSMISQCEQSADVLAHQVDSRRQLLVEAQKRLLAQARSTADDREYRDD